VETAATYTIAAYVRDGLQIVVLIGMAVALHWKLALVMLTLVPLAAWPVSRLTKRLLAKTREGQQRLGAIAAQIHEGLGGLRTIQAFNGQEAEAARFDGHAAAHVRATSRAAWIRGATPALMEILAASAIAGA